MTRVVEKGGEEVLIVYRIKVDVRRRNERRRMDWNVGGEKWADGRQMVGTQVEREGEGEGERQLRWTEHGVLRPEISGYEGVTRRALVLSLSPTNSL